MKKNINLEALYQEAAQGNHPAVDRTEQVHLLGQYVGTLSQVLQDAGFKVAHEVLAFTPQANLKMTIDGDTHDFQLTIPDKGADLSNKLVVSGNADGSLREFTIYNDDGSIPITRFEDMSMTLAKHLAVECGRKVYQQQQHIMRLADLARYTV